jgi:hypothetical protein
MTINERLAQAWVLMKSIDDLYTQTPFEETAEDYSLLLDLEADLEEQLELLERDLEPREVELAFLAVGWNLGKPVGVTSL